jgi:ATP-dependent RNA helicase DHX36
LLDEQHLEATRPDFEPGSAQIHATADLPSVEKNLLEPDSASSIMRPPDHLPQLQPYIVVISQETLTEIVATLAAARKAGLPDAVAPLVEDQQDFEPYDDRKPREDLASVSLRLFEEHCRLINQSARRGRILERAKLPMNRGDIWKRIVGMVRDTNISIIVGTTGSGKTTQVPQLILDHSIMDKKSAYCNIICTQPRWIATTSVARCVAYERNEPPQKSVGYQVRYDTRLPEHGGSITYCTTSILLKRLLYHPDEIMESYSHLIVDEAHE